MNTRIGLKILGVLIMAFISVCIFNINTVNSVTEFTDNDRDVIITLDENLGIEGIKTECSNYDYEYTEGARALVNKINILGVNQNKLNEFAKNSKTFIAKIKMKLPSNDFEKVVWLKRTYENGKALDTEKKDANIETINGNKYIVYSCELKYNNIQNDKPVDDNIRYISIHSGGIEWISDGETYIKIISNDSSYNIYNTMTNINIYSENQPFNYSYQYVNQYDKSYTDISGIGTGSNNEDKWYQTEQNHIEGSFGFLGNTYLIPKTTNLSNTYFKLNIDVYQGENIQVDNFGTLIYSGREKNTYNVQGKQVSEMTYVYKNSLSNLKNPTKTLTFKAKAKNGYTYTRCITKGWELSDNVKEEKVTGIINTNNQQLTANITFCVKGNGNAKIETIEIPKSDNLYKKLQNGVNNVVSADKNNIVNLAVYDIQVIEGSYEGKLNLTFDIGEENNGKEYVVSHLKNGLDYEYFKGVVENGKVNITVESLSPFMISLIEEEKGNNAINQEPSSIEKTEQKELDDTPKTGIADYTVYAITTIVAVVIGLISLKNIERSKKRNED